MSDQTGDLTPEGEETIAAEQEARPDWLPDNFPNGEALVKSYQELQTKLGSQGSELGQMREQMEEMLELMQQPATPQYTDPNQNPLVQEFERAYQEGDVQRMLGVQAQLSQAVVQQALEAQGKNGQDGRELDPYLVGQMHDQIATRYEADDAMKAKALEIMESHPLVAQRLQEIAADPNSTIGDLAPAVDTAYQLAKMGVVSAEQQSLAQKQKEAEVARERKIASETLSSSGPTRVATASEQKSVWDSIKNADDGRLIIGDR